MKRNNLSSVKLPLRDFIHRVAELLARRGIIARRTIVAVLRRLKERGIWPVKNQEKHVELQEKNTENQEHKTAESPKTGVSTDDSAIRELTEQAHAYLADRYDVRYNVLDGRPEIRLKAYAAADVSQLERERLADFRPVDELVLNTLVLHLHAAGIGVWDRDVKRLVCSFLPEQYHPLTAWLEQLPQWDGTDRVRPLAARVSDDALWHSVFHTWMRAAVRQMWCATEVHRTAFCQTDISTRGGNQLAPVLISREQGLHKSTFCQMLLPEALRTYYTDKFELAGRTNHDLELSRFALINLDEFDRYSPAQMVRLKNLMQLSEMNVRRPHARFYEKLCRTASFIGTSNTAELLTDPTGSRRFFCQEVTAPIDCATPIDYPQLYAQLLAEVLRGEPCTLSSEEQEAVEEHNRAYYRASALREAFLATYEVVEDGAEESDGVWLTATEIYTALSEKYSQRVLSGSPSQLGRQLTFVGVRRRHTEKGTEYLVASRMCKCANVQMCK